MYGKRHTCRFIEHLDWNVLRSTHITCFDRLLDYFCITLIFSVSSFISSHWMTVQYTTVLWWIIFVRSFIASCSFVSAQNIFLHQLFLLDSSFTKTVIELSVVYVNTMKSENSNHLDVKCLAMVTESYLSSIKAS